MTRQFQWDDTKNQENIRKHGISFAEAVEIFDGPISLRLMNAMSTMKCVKSAWASSVAWSC